MRTHSSSPIRALAAVLILAPLLACATLTVSDEKQLGKQFEREMQGELLLMRDKTVNRYVSDIGEKILEAAGPQLFDYRFFVIEDDDINAMAGPAGAIYINTGTILKAANVSELAGVMAHEIGHVANRHIAQNYSRQMGTNMLYQLGVVGASFFGLGGIAQLGGNLAAMAVLNSFGRVAEMEADEYAVRVLPAAGYDPEGMLTFFETLQREGGSNVPTFLSSHPATKDRIDSTRARIAALPPSDVRLRVHDRGKLEIIQRRILLLTGKVGGRK